LVEPRWGEEESRAVGALEAYVPHASFSPRCFRSSRNWRFRVIGRGSLSCAPLGEASSQGPGHGGILVPSLFRKLTFVIARRDGWEAVGPEYTEQGSDEGHTLLKRSLGESVQFNDMREV